MAGDEHDHDWAAMSGCNNVYLCTHDGCNTTARGHYERDEVVCHDDDSPLHETLSEATGLDWDDHANIRDGAVFQGVGTWQVVRWADGRANATCRERERHAPDDEVRLDMSVVRGDAVEAFCALVDQLGFGSGEQDESILNDGGGNDDG